MKGFPKHINNRVDLDNLREVYPNETKLHLQNIYDNRMIWQSLGVVEQGVEDATHKIITDEDTNDTYQFELVENLSLINKYNFNSYNELLSYITGE